MLNSLKTQKDVLEDFNILTECNTFPSGLRQNKMSIAITTLKIEEKTYISATYSI